MMRGFSNRGALALKTRAEQEMGEPFNFARYAPERPRLITYRVPTPDPSMGVPNITSWPAIDAPIAASWHLAMKHFAAAFACLWNIVRVIGVRTRARIKIAFHKVMQARKLPWVLTGWGWGMSLGLMMIVVMK